MTSVNTFSDQSINSQWSYLKPKSTLEQVQPVSAQVPDMIIEEDKTKLIVKSVWRIGPNEKIGLEI